ncbi:membrane protein [Kordiimonas sediminis]|uniref:Membrane protein n=1 Tax=Kordiimonas sediminis TaxID=1735581 RepID=A0A919APP8_9PROT|nr:LemA family protein [Kordiimonas sediminis]GHF18850.1 membrane protein [Kordiimonas sediminis]
MIYYGVIGGLILLAVFVISIYNKLVVLRTRTEEAWSDIDVQMKRRYDLIPNLIETVKGYASHEKETLENVIAARNTASKSTGTPGEQSGAENILSGALRQLFAVSEAYPELKANTNFQQLQTDLSEIEDHIQKSRRYFNGSVRDLNTMVESFPSNLIAGQFGFHKSEYFELDEAEAGAVKTAPKVTFN